MPVKFSEYKEIELLVVRMTKYFRFRVRILRGMKTVSSLQPWKDGEEWGLEQSGICSVLVSGHLWGQRSIEFFF